MRRAEDWREIEACAEADAIAEVLSGSTDAFRPLVAKYERPVFGLCRRLMRGSDDEAEDLTQETFVRAYRFLNALKDPHRFGPWLFRIARSLCRDRLRRLETERRALKGHAVTLEHRLRGASSAHDALGGAECTSALNELPEVQRRALELRYFDGLSYNELAERLSLTFAQADHLIRKARAHLERRLKVRIQNERSV